ncbi:hypothetical protein LINGRAHAP2_LOCUS19786 [Linum grandiflorum]
MMWIIWLVLGTRSLMACTFLIH